MQIMIMIYDVSVTPYGSTKYMYGNTQVRPPSGSKNLGASQIREVI